MYVERFALPGIGTRHVFRTAAGRRVGVIWHREGRRDLFLYDADDFDADDPDRALSVSLTRYEAATLAMLLTGVEAADPAVPGGSGG